jgi:phospholipid-translocating ATPase
MISFFVTVSGWFAWNAFLSGVYARAPSPYSVRDGFTTTFGPDPVWWATLVVVLAVLALMELTFKTVKRNLIMAGLWKLPPWSRWGKLGAASGGDSVEEWDLGLWQEMEMDPVVKERLVSICQAEEEGYEEVCQETKDG